MRCVASVTPLVYQKGGWSWKWKGNDLKASQRHVIMKSSQDPLHIQKYLKAKSHDHWDTCAVLYSSTFQI